MHETDPELLDLLRKAARHKMTPEEIEAQRASFVRAFTTPCEHGVLDFETCVDCRGKDGRRAR